MNATQVKTFGDFQVFVSTLARTQQDYIGTLEEYLRALWKLIRQYRGNKVTFSLFAKLLQDAFTTQPLPFEEKWLIYNEPPDLPGDRRNINLDDFAILQHIICYQIADLHLMALDGTLKKPHIYLGATSSTGHSWYNFDPSSFLSCSAQSIENDSQVTDCNWTDLAVILWLGQIYE